MGERCTVMSLKTGEVFVGQFTDESKSVVSILHPNGGNEWNDPWYEQVEVSSPEYVVWSDSYD